MQMNNPIGKTPLDDQPNGIVGKPLDRVDGRLKVTGGAVYAYEVEQGPQTAYGYVVQASIGKGRIRSIDSRVAEKMPGVVLVLTHLNAPEQGTGNHHEAHPVLVGPEVSYYGEPVAFVVAETFEQARAAAYAVRVSYETAAGHLRAAGRPAAGPCSRRQQRAAGQRGRQFRTGVRRGIGAARRHVHDAAAEPHDDGAARDAGDVGRRQADAAHLEPDAEPGCGSGGEDPENSAGERAAGKSLHRRRVRLEAMGECRCHPGRHRREAAQAAGEDRADAASRSSW